MDDVARTTVKKKEASVNKSEEKEVWMILQG